MNPVPRIDKRSERSRAVVLEETYRQLSQNGLANVSIDEISRASGVSKTTIYRHWSSRSALLIDACSRFGGAFDVPDSGSLRSDLRILLEGLAKQLGTASWSSAVPSIVDAAERDADVRAMQAGWHAGLMRPFGCMLDQARRRGELMVEVGVSDLIALTVGALFYRRWFSREPIDAPFLERVVSTAAATIAD